MAWDYTLSSHFTVASRVTVKWPCVSLPDRTVELFPGDVLTPTGDGKFTKHNGLCMTNIDVPDDVLVPVDEPVNLVVGGGF